MALLEKATPENTHKNATKFGVMILNDKCTKMKKCFKYALYKTYLLLLLLVVVVVIINLK